MAQLVKNLPAMWETWVPSLGWEDPLEKGKAPHSSILAWRIPENYWRRERVPTPPSWASLVAQLVKNLPAMREAPGSVPGLGRSPGEGNGSPLQYCGLRIPWTAHRVAESRTRLSDFFHFSGALGSSGVQLGVLVTWAQRRPVFPTGQSSRG